MAVQDDHMIRNIQDVGRLIAKLLLHEQQPDYKLPENEEDYTEADKLFSTVMKLAEEGKINEAENELYMGMVEDDADYLELALTFYLYLNDMDGDFLDDNDYSREEVLEGMKDLASIVVEKCEEETHYAPIYDVNDSIENKIFKIATTVYGAKDVEFSDEAKETIALYQKYGWDKLPICMAKTQNSLSDDAKLVGRPVDFTIHVRNINISRGAGFIVAYTGNVLTMPGLPKVPAAINMGIDENGETYGLF